MLSWLKNFKICFSKYHFLHTLLEQRIITMKYLTNSSKLTFFSISSSGQPIPHITYTDTENKTWESVFNTVNDLVKKHACQEYRVAFQLMMDEGIFRPQSIPQLEEVSNFLRRQTGFTLRPAAGLLTARDFLASLAFRIFQSTQYVRHHNAPSHTPEP